MGDIYGTEGGKVTGFAQYCVYSVERFPRFIPIGLYLTINFAKYSALIMQQRKSKFVSTGEVGVSGE